MRTARPAAVQPAPAAVRGAALSAAIGPVAGPQDFAEVADLKKRAYLAALVCHRWKLGVAAQAIGVTVRTTYNWRHDESDEVFQRALADAHEIYLDWCEAELDRRGFEGVEEPVYQQGRLVGTVRRFDTVAGIFRLKGERPAKYRERQELTGAGGGPLQVQPVPMDLSKLSDAEFAELERIRALARIAGTD